MKNGGSSDMQKWVRAEHEGRHDVHKVFLPICNSPVNYSRVRLALYDLRTDPGETLDVKEKYPEVVQQLTVIADRYRSEIGDDLTKQKEKRFDLQPK